MQKKKKQEQVITAWTELKAKIMNLKTQSKNNWAVIKPKSTPQRVFVAQDKSLEQMKQQLQQIQQLIAQHDWTKLQRLYEQGGI